MDIFIYFMIFNIYRIIFIKKLMRSYNNKLVIYSAGGLFSLVYLITPTIFKREKKKKSHLAIKTEIIAILRPHVHVLR